MKTSIVLLITAIAVIAACCGPHFQRFQSHPRTWVLNFNRPTLVDLSAFTGALDKATDRIEHITIKDTPSTTPHSRPVVSNPPTTLPTLTAPTQNYPKNQGDNTGSLHVTQKVTLFTDEEANAVMHTIKVP